MEFNGCTGLSLVAVCLSLFVRNAAGQCPVDKPIVTCLLPPCDVSSCPEYPDAVCTNNYCGGCNAIWKSGNVDVTDKCEKVQCPPDKPIVRCFVAPCSVSQCPEFPNAVCTDNYCGGCNAVWKDGNATVTDKCSKRYVRLARGNSKSHGIVEVNQGNEWRIFCAWPQFGTKDADVICKELGFKKGYVLPISAYGPLTGNYSSPFKGCEGTEKSLRDCSFDEMYSPNVCETQNTYYGSVNCIIEDKTPGNLIKLVPSKMSSDATEHPGNNGHISIFRQQMFGQICASYFTDSEANVTCRELGFSGGVSMVYDAYADSPFLITGIHCKGNETKLTECYTEIQICYDRKSAGVLCYNSTGISVRIDGKYKGRGAVILNVDDVEGTICGEGWDNSDAAVVCRQLGYATGSANSGNSSSDHREVFLSDVKCTGDEASVFACPGSGWRNVNKTVCDHTNDAMAFCDASVRVLGYRQETAIMGIVEVYQKHYWTTLCADGFDEADGTVVCRQLGFPNTRILLPGMFGRSLRYSYTTSINCTGKEKDILDCPHQRESCSSYNYASVLCYSRDADDKQMFLEKGDSGKVVFSQYGVKGTVCREGWDDVDAKVLCRQHGYNEGQVYGTPDVLARYQPIWLTNVQCTGQESNIIDCPASYNITKACGNDRSAAGAICYNKKNGMQVRLKGGSSPNNGRVEVSRDSKWGTICHNRWSAFDALVVCNQLGYADGTPYHGSYHGPGTGFVLMDGLSCSGKEQSIFECPNLGWNVSDFACLWHNKDAGVYCHPWVQLSFKVYGAVQFWKKGVQYGLVCAEGFDQRAANVVCKEMKYNYAINFCCHSFGRDLNSVPFTMSNVQCSGKESSLRECSYEDVKPSCKNHNYASVYCSSTDPSKSQIRATVGGNRNLVKIHFLYRDGLICSEGFTNNDAQVICKENLFQSGLAVRHYTPYNQHDYYVRWLSNISCQGTETRVRECPSVNVGQLGNCNLDISAGVICFTSKDPPAVQVRPTNGSKPTEGRIEVNLDGKWGPLCAGNLTDKEANVLCKQSGYRDGVALLSGKFGAGSENTVLNYLKCDGSESSILDCVVGLVTTTTTCTPSYASAIKCYETVRLTGQSRADYGRLEMWHEDKWYSVCDQGFNDVDASVVCRYFGYKLGKAQCCSALGENGTRDKILYSNFACTGNENSPLTCKFEKTGQCSSGRYVTVLCLEDATQEDLKIQLNKFYSPVYVKRYGIYGQVCDKNFDDIDATAVCKTKKYNIGHALRTYVNPTLPILMGNVTCSKSARSITECTYTDFGENHGCVGSKTVAGVLCTNKDDLKYKVFGFYSITEGFPMISANVKYGLTLDSTKFGELETNLFCQNAGFAGGQRIPDEIYSTSQMVDVTDIACSSNAKSILKCIGNWGSTNGTKKKLDKIACFHSVRLQNGGHNYGSVEIHKDKLWGTACPVLFGESEAKVTCKPLGFQNGIPICCSPFGNEPSKQLYKDISCTGNEESILQCKHTFDASGVSCSKSSRNYASVLCYSGSLSKDFYIRLRGNQFFSDVIITYMGVHGRICKDGWDDADARVACRQMNFMNGLAYNHYVEEGQQSNGPYWTSNVQCKGTEKYLKECKHDPLGSVKECKSLHYAGVLCLDDQGIYYRITGGDPSTRSGRAEIFIDKKWGTFCNVNWRYFEARTLCKHFGFRDGDPYGGPYRHDQSGPIYDPSYRCTGTETDLNDCPHNGWKETQTEECKDHKNDAGVFCYQNVRIYNSIGRNSLSGPVSVFRGNRWYLLCDDGFNDYAAKLVCQELGFVDGSASCCSRDGPIGFPILMNHTMSCVDTATNVEDCLKISLCSRNSYASVTCSYSIIIPQRSTTVLPGVTNKATGESNNTVVAVVCTVVAFLLVGVIAIVIAIKCRRSKSKGTHGQFKDGVLQRTHDGSFIAQNPLHDIPDAVDDITIHHGSVQYFQSNNDTSSPAFTNLTYVTLRNNEADDTIDDDHLVAHKDTKPLAGKSDLFEDSSYGEMNPNFQESGIHVYDNLGDKTYHNCVTIEKIPEDNTYDNLRQSLAESKEIQSPT